MSAPPSAEAIRTWTDTELLDERNKVTREPGDPLSDALSAEIERRGVGLLR